MSDELNPYQSPEAAIVPLSAQAAPPITEAMLLYLKEASPWLRFIGIVGFITSGSTVLWSIASFVMIPLLRQAWEQVPGLESFGGIFSGSMVIFFIGGGALVFFPSLFIYRFGDKIRSYLRSGAEKELEIAFRNNKSIWKFCGILCIVYLAFIPLLITVSIIVGVAAAFL
jgi:hypothetical protein